MTDDSFIDLRDSLCSRLNDELPKDSVAPPERVHWLARHVREYVDRWVGFVEHPSVTTQPIAFAFSGGMFLVIGVAMDLIESELAEDIRPETLAAWRRFARLYCHVRDTRDLSSREQLLRLAEEFETRSEPAVEA